MYIVWDVRKKTFKVQPCESLFLSTYNHTIRTDYRSLFLNTLPEGYTRCYLCKSDQCVYFTNPILLKLTNMNQMKINVPNGYVIDINKSNISTGEIFFKPKKLTYNDICMKLFEYNYYFIEGNGSISLDKDDIVDRPNYSASKKQLESILALNMLCNVAKYLNEGWLPTLIGTRWAIVILTDGEMVPAPVSNLDNQVWFKTHDLANQAIKILGEPLIRKAFKLNH